jgi:ABC-type transport system substrate-binding protein
VSQQTNWSLGSVQVASSHLYAQGQNGYKPATTSTTTTLAPGSAPTPPSSTSSTVIGAGGSVNFPATPELAQADELMTASGQERTDGSTWHSAFGIPLVLHLAIDSADPWAVASAPQIVDDLNSAGFAVETYNADSATQAGSVMADGFADLALIPLTTTPFLSEAMAWYTMLLGPAGQNGSQDWTGYDDPTFDQLVTTASQQLSPTVAATDYAAADQQLWSEIVSLPLFTEPSALAYSRTIGNVTATPTSDSFLWYAQFWDKKVPEPTNNTTPSLPTP